MNDVIPVFPLNTVLFPGMVLSVRVFEDRYKEMMDLCIREQQPFGVVLIKEGSEVGDTPVPFHVGTMAAIKIVNKLEDDKLEVKAVGQRRFRIEKLLTDKAYLSAEISEFPIREGSRIQAEAMARSVRPRFMEYVDLLDKAVNLKLKLLDDPPRDPEGVASLVAIAMQIELRDKQRIIEAERVEDMLKVESGILAREHAILNFVLETKDDANELGFGPTGQFHPN